MKLRLFAFAAGLATLTAPAFGDTTIKILHVNNNPAAIALWDKIGKDYEADHKGVKIEFQYLENEAFKAKLPTMLQSADCVRPCSTLGRRRHGGAVPGRLPQGHHDRRRRRRSHLLPTAVDAFKVEGKAVGVPWDTGGVVFFYNKQLFNKAGVKAEDIKSWDDFLAR